MRKVTPASSSGYRTIERYLAWVPRQGPAPVPAGLAESAARAGLHSIGVRPYFLACDPDPRGHGAEGPLALASVFASERGDAAEGRREKDAYDAVSDFHSFFTLIRAADDSLEIEGDWLSLMPCYHAEYRDGTLIGSRIVDLLRVDPGLARPADPLALAELVAFRHPLGDRTLHQRVRRTRTGEVLRYDTAGGFAMFERPRVTAGADDRICTPDEAVDSMLAILTTSVRRLASRRGKNLGIGLSAGLDSRMIAAICRAAGIPFTTYCYGRAWQREMAFARQVGRAIGADPVLLDYPGGHLLDDRDLFLRTVEGQADLSAAQITNLLRISDRQRLVLLHGFLGDALGGAHLAWFPPEAYGSRREIASAVTRRCAGDLAGALRLLRLPVVEGDLVDEVERGLDPALPPFRAFLQWDLQQRQRRYIGAHFQLLGGSLETAAPFCDRAYAAFALSLPEPLLRGRYLTLRALRTRFPDLARIPHSNDSLPALPRTRDRIRVGAKATARRLLGTSVWDGIRWRMRALRGPDFWDLASGEALKAPFLAGAADAQAALADTLGLEIDSRHLRGERMSTALARAVFTVGSYAQLVSGIVRS